MACDRHLDLLVVGQGYHRLVDGPQAKLLQAVRTLTDRTLVIEAPDGSTGDRRELRLCSSGRVTDSLSSDEGTPEGQVDGQWTVAASGASILLLLDEGGASPAVFGIELRTDGTVAVDDEVVTVRDARSECADADLQARLTEALSGTAYFFFLQAGTIPVRVKLGLCDSGRYWLESTSREVGAWHVQVTDGVAGLVLVRDTGLSRLPTETSFADDGSARVHGTPPLDDTSLVDAACQS